MLTSHWKELLQQPGALPALPEVLIRLQAALHHLDIDIDQLCGELQRDPVLVAEIIKTINSPLFGVPRRIESLKQAVVLLGLRRVRAIILSQSLRQALATYQSPAFRLVHWWDRSILNAVAAAALCQRASPENVEEAFLAGLIADLGILILARHEPRYEQVLRAHGDCPGVELCQATRDALGLDHAELAGEVLESWRFPPMVILAVRRHHDPAILADPQSFFLPRSIYFACLLTDSVVSSDPAIDEQLAKVAANYLFISRGELDDFRRACLERYRAIAAPLGQGCLAGDPLPPAAASSA